MGLAVLIIIGSFVVVGALMFLWLDYLPPKHQSIKDKTLKFKILFELDSIQIVKAGHNTPSIKIIGHSYHQFIFTFVQWNSK
jgi:hypothetical protein